MPKNINAAEFWTPERRAEDQRIRELELQNREQARELGDALNAEAFKHPQVPFAALACLRYERQRLGLSDNDMATHGLDADALASMLGYNPNPSLSTLQAYAKAVGKRIRIMFDDADSPEARKADHDEQRRQEFLARKRDREAGS
ncbi:hypothetical protein [Candidatus Entotheonella palauensis]|uniref:Uncharacterized protein n=1 Tax=Candidatus Entotheonella gemina TaxID=1429439 RepID=W4MFM7_9BACT|nr:hypothetical protein [Candidatus Entotheonella palauensis]ETX08721.1 MAG: hypothetical protein ETSY2_03705 [Candidatus Entotheonella gemina]